MTVGQLFGLLEGLSSDLKIMLSTDEHDETLELAKDIELADITIDNNGKIIVEKNSTAWNSIVIRTYVTEEDYTE